MADVLTKGTDCPQNIDLEGKPSSLFIDGQALVVAIGKPGGAHTFGDLADKFISSGLQGGSQYHRVDVIFDRYRLESIKTRTRQRCTKNVIRRGSS